MNALNLLKKTFFIFLLSALVLLFNICWRQLTQGFRPHKIVQALDFEETSSLPFSLEKKVLSILNQPFTYLGKGSQCYVFSSQDDQYVLKFIALNKYKEPFRRNLLSFFPLLPTYREKKIFNRRRNFHHTLDSYKIAALQLKKETGTIYFHYKKNPRLKKIHLIDKMKMSYQIDPNKAFFIIQKKAKKLHPLLTACIQKKEKKAIEAIIQNYLDLSFSIVKKGIINRDSSIKNLGYIQKKIIEVDIGRFFFIKNKEDPLIFNTSLEEHTKLYRKFLESNAPEMLHFFDTKLNQLKSSL